MSDFWRALKIIKHYEGFNEKAYCDPETGADPFTIGYGTQYYPDDSPVKQGHRCTKEKALEYLLHEITEISVELDKLDLPIDHAMKEALISFIHSVGWKPFLYSNIVDACDREDWVTAVQDINSWIYDTKNNVIAPLIERRSEEAYLFLSNVDCAWTSQELLLKVFRDYAGAPHEVRAIRSLQRQINPYILAQFHNDFYLKGAKSWEISPQDLDKIFSVGLTE